MTEPFDVCGPLPTGVTVLEASAGTGKTYTIAALAARYVADGVPLDQLLMVTFTRMATGELRERVRERLVSAEQGLERALAGAPPEDDAVVQLLASGSPTPRSRCAASASRRALADFDSATIATTHGFCQEVLGGLGVPATSSPTRRSWRTSATCVDEVVDDLYVRRFARRGTPRVQPRRGDGDRAHGDRQPGRADRAGRRARRLHRRHARPAGRRCAHGARGAQAAAPAS